MASPAFGIPRASALPFAATAATVAVLYLAREVIIPLALAMLFAFLLAPAARRLESWHLGRILSTLLVVALFVGALGAVGWIAGREAVNLVGKLPEYRQNIQKKIQALRSPPRDGELGKAAKAIKELQKDIDPKKGGSAKPAPEAATVAVPTTALELIGYLGISLATLLVMAVAVVVITALMLLQRDDLRERILRLAGEGRIPLTTQALQDAAQRVSRYLLMQLVVNICYGLPLGVALHLAGLPNALLFGMLATVLRFIPYLGAAIAAALPVALAFTISDGWALVAWTVGIIAVLEFIVGYVIEPWLYGASTGLSPIAIVLAAIFWTWLWGPLGLLLATPMTVCLAVAGRHTPQLGFLNVILGVEPVLPAGTRFYQRLLAFEYDEALELAEEHARKHGALPLCEEVLLPALVLAKRDRQRGSLEESRERFAFESLRRIAEEFPVERPEGAVPPVCVVAAHEEADHIAAILLARLLAGERYESLLLPNDQPGSGLMEAIAQRAERTIVVSAVPPSAASDAGYLAKRLHSRFPQHRIIAGLWSPRVERERVDQRLGAAGASEVVTSFTEALQRLGATRPA
jgi:predicted PurR-regulated permease PerM